MFRKLRIQMTIFCTLITGSILICLSVLCLIFAGNSLTKNSYASFLKELNTILTQLQSQNSISHQWLRQVQLDHHFQISLYDNGNPLYFQSLIGDANGDFIDEAISTAQTNYDMNIFQNTASLLPSHQEFTLKDSNHASFYVSAGKIPKSNGLLSYVVLYDLSSSTRQLTMLYLGIAFANLIALMILGIFSWFFTGRMLVPLEANQKKQTQFISAASHELRSPLTVILSGLESMEKSDSSTDWHHFARLIKEEGLRMQHLISDMLLLANSDSSSFSIHKVYHQPDGILLNIYEKQEPLAKNKKINLKLQLPDEILPDCNCDYERMIQLCTILVDNALSYTPSGGEITLSLSHRKTHSGNGRFLFAVIDTGVGIPDSEKKLVFEHFYRSESSHTDKEHFGLGLCIAKELTQLHKGKIWICDTAGGGATFFVEIPE